MRRIRKAPAVALATATVLGVLGLTAAAQAATVTKKIPAGVETAVGLKLGSINGTAPTTGSGTGTAINPSFTATFLNPIYDVVRFDATTPDHIPAYLEPIYAAASAATPGWACSSATAKADLKHYGYLLSPLCGAAS
jgi:hypothetical protein